MKQHTVRRRSSKNLERIVALVLTTTLGGCATQAQMLAYKIQENFAAAVKVSEDCNAKFRTLPVYGRLNQDFILEENDPDILRKLAIKRRVSSEQATDILAASKIMRICEKPSLQMVESASPSVAAVMKQLDAEWDQGIQKVIDKSPTIGEANKLAQDHRKRAQALAQQVGQELGVQLARAHQHEIAQREAAVAALRQVAYAQAQIANQMQADNAARMREFEGMQQKRDMEQQEMDMRRQKMDMQRMKSDADQAQSEMQQMKWEQQRLKQQLQQTRQW
jgi:hypothetical protein